MLNTQHRIKYILHLILLPLLFLAGLKSSAQQNKASHHLNSFPKPVQYANDMEGIYSAAQLRVLDSLLQAFDKKSGVQIKLVTIDSNFAARYKVDEIVRKIGEWELSKNVFADSTVAYNGILVMLSKWSGRVQVFSESSFYRIGELLDNTESNEIIREAMGPMWKKAQYYEATANGLQSLIKRIEEVLKQKEKENIKVGIIAFR